MVASNIGTNTPLAANQPIELAFDRLLLPITVTRQSFVLFDKADTSTAITFSIAYDPVARVVTMTPLQALTEGHNYELDIVSELDPESPNGLHAIDGATMDPKSPQSVTFAVSAASATPPVTCNGIAGPCMDFCNDIVPILSPTCAGSGVCHNGVLFEHKSPLAAGLALTGGGSYPAAQLILATAIDRLSIEASMGPLSEPGPPSFHFPQDMPIIDTATLSDPNDPGNVAPKGSGDPGNSFLIYKTLMAETGSLPATATALPNVYSVSWSPLSGGERETLATLIPGREMPLATAVTDTVNTGLAVDSLERLSLWIAEGAPLSDCP
jgi:hypothetical protein